MRRIRIKIKLSRLWCLGVLTTLLPSVLYLAVDAKTPPAKSTIKKPALKTGLKNPGPKKQNPSGLKPMSGAQMDTYVPIPISPQKINSASEFSGTSTPVKPRMLQGAAEHSESLPAEDSRFSAGTRFDASAIPKVTASNVWYWLPPWFAGVYQTENIVGVYRYDFRTGKTDVSRRTSVNRRIEKWGWQQDRMGGVWQYDSTPYQIEVDRGAQKEIQWVKKRVPVRIGQDIAVLKFLSTSIIVNRQTGKIDWTVQSEFLQTYRPISPNRIELTVSAKLFDAEGRPMTLDKNIQYLERLSGFIPEDYYNGKDMRALFREFLLSRNRPDLILDNRQDSRSGF